jgi:hypothetical protein
MTDLTWTEKEVAGELAGSLMAIAALVKQRPEKAEQICMAVIADLGSDERGLLAALHGHWMRRNGGDRR